MAAEGTPALLCLPALADPGLRLSLARGDSHYVSRVCRARVGETLEATDGRGSRATLRLVEVGDVVVAEVVALTHEDPARPAWILCGAPEGERADWLIEKLAELGVTRFVPVDCVRSRWKRASGRRARWERLVVAALRQSRRCHLMAVEEPAPLGRALAGLPPGGGRWLAEVTGAPPEPKMLGAAGAMIGLIGPAEGLDEEEKAEALAAGFAAVRLSDGRLRCETAAVALAAWWAAGG